MLRLLFRTVRRLAVYYSMEVHVDERPDTTKAPDWLVPGARVQKVGDWPRVDLANGTLGVVTLVDSSHGRFWGFEVKWEADPEHHPHRLAVVEHPGWHAWRGNVVPVESAAPKASSVLASTWNFMRPMQPDEVLAPIVGSSPLPRTEVVKRVWAYIKERGLQDAKERRFIHADEKLLPVFDGKQAVSMFEMTRLVNKHLIDVP